MSKVTEAQVIEALSHVIEPELHKDLVTLDMIKKLHINDGQVAFTIMLTTPACPLKHQMEAEATAALLAIPGVEKVNISFDSNVPADARLLGKMNIGVRNAIAVASGKGGVGKSTMSANLALSLALDGAKVGLLDADVYGPNIPMMMGVNERPKGQNNKIIPPQAYGVKIMSMGFLVDPNQPVIWRGPMIHNALRQFLQDVEWGDLDYLVVDLPPGTGDASLSLAQSLSLTGAVIVTTPQKVALSDVIRGVAMFQQLNVPILGVIENMSYFVAPDTGHRYDIFGHGGGATMAKEVGVDFLGEVPLEPQVRIGGDEGSPIVVRAPESAAAQALHAVAQKVAAAVSVQNLLRSPRQFQADPTLSILS
ncbi:MAG TPA: Mrp/NBP35 family ATP-binding protein [Anaerolineae bacterium]|nr:Mrp/NBP35 family ATP-binding protein [Anaerolineae bacterium]